jgi:hypothetical protein
MAPMSAAAVGVSCTMRPSNITAILSDSRRRLSPPGLGTDQEGMWVDEGRLSLQNFYVVPAELVFDDLQLTGDHRVDAGELGRVVCLSIGQRWLMNVRSGR